MSRCRLHIVLDRPDAVFAAGETLTGHVAVQVRQRCECRALTLDCAWDLPGAASVAAHATESSTLFEGVWEPGSYQYPFEFIVPNGPFTYSGKLFSIRWLLKARADLPRAVDPKAKIPFTLVPGPTDAPVDHGPKHDPEAAPNDHQRSKKILALLSLAALSFGGICLYRFVFYDSPGLVQILVGGGLGAVSVLGGLYMLYLAFRDAVAQRILGPVDVQLTPLCCVPGSPLTCTVRLRPPKTVFLNAIDLSLVGEELRVEEISDETSTFADHLIHEEQQRFCEEQHVEAGEEVTLTAQFTLPTDAPYTFAAHNVDVTWKLRVHIDLPNWPDWTFYHPITVTPVMQKTNRLDTALPANRMESK